VNAFTIATLNVNGLRSAADKGLVRWLRRRRPDFLCLQELRAHPDQVPDKVRSPEGWSTRWLVPERKGYSGVALYSREPADRYTEGVGLDWADDEARCLRADFGELAIVDLYVPSGARGKRQPEKYAFLDHLFGHTRALLDEERPTLICGDLNIAHTELDIHNPSGNRKSSGFLPDERAWFTDLLEQGWVDVLRAQNPDEPGLYSWWSNMGRARELDRGWRLDYVLATPDLAERATKAWIDKKAGLSDHAPVLVEFGG